VQVRAALENDNSWSFDVLQLERVSEHHALSQLALKVGGREDYYEWLES